ncbi:Metallo-beta-lactamase superfamily protein [Mycena kentingensis (nom. inval.)]|nr:Metallo-beta-lactamase superfamily protein [Mycena kentingensis (nom. inval.)]
MLALSALSVFLPLVAALRGVPESKSTVRVSRFNVGNITAVGIASALVTPVLPGHENATSAMYSFLIEHGSRKMLFDLGLRKDTENFAPSIAALFGANGVFVAELDGDITDMLETAGIPPRDIEAVVWSHAHFDHTGDMSKFPDSTKLVIGTETDTSTYPANPNASLLESDLSGRNVTKIDFAASNLTFNDLKAFDYFGDGSFYLVDTPGHLTGHLTALARVTPSPNPTFILLGGDTFFHPGQARPRPALQESFPCPAHFLHAANAHISTDYFFSPGSHDGPHGGGFDLRTRASALLSISDLPDGFATDPVLAEVSLEKVARWDADEDVLVLITHDLSVVSNDTLPYFPHSLNGWKKGGWKEKAVWNFLDVESSVWRFS